MKLSLKFILITVLFCLLFLACRPGFLDWSAPTRTATPTKTPTSPPTATPDPSLFTPTPTATLPPPTSTHTPIPPTHTPIPTPAAEPTAVPEPPTNTPVPVPPTPLPEVPPTETPAANTAETTPASETAATAPVSQEDTAYKIVHYKVLGENENNGGIFDKGGQHLIFLTVLDENGQGVDGAVVKDANGSSLEVVTGSKGPGKAEISMEWEPYRLYVVADPQGPTTSEISNPMNTAFPHIPDIVGKLGSIDNEYSVCPTSEIRCTPPFYSVHFSYEITFQKVK